MLGPILEICGMQELAVFECTAPSLKKRQNSVLYQNSYLDSVQKRPKEELELPRLLKYPQCENYLVLILLKKPNSRRADFNMH